MTCDSRACSLARARVELPVVTRERVKSTPGVYALTRIYLVAYLRRMESAFAVIAEPNRRAILSLLVSEERSVHDLEHELRMTQPSVSKHLRILRDAGFVESRVEAQRRLYRVRAQPLMEIDEWLAPFRRFWTAHVDALERHLDRLDPLPLPEPTARGKAKPRRRR
jgi:DNA-binding transcriptional ArsR family regulator